MYIPVETKNDEATDQPYHLAGSSTLQSNAETAQLREAIARNINDPNELTNLIFFSRHKERQGRKLSRGEPQFKQLAEEWLQIRDTLVRPILVSAPSVKRSRWHHLIKNTVPCPPVKTLVDGQEIFGEMVKAIRTATGPGHFIYILGWMMQSDFRLDPSDDKSEMRMLLQEAAGKGVEVRVLVWNNPTSITANRNSFMSIHKPPYSVFVIDNATYGSPALAAVIRQVQSAMNRVETTLKLIGIGAGIFPFPMLTQSIVSLLPEKWREAHALVRNPPANQGAHHEKVIIVKGENEKENGLIGFCGGADINDNRLTNMHDVHCRVEGHAAWRLLQRFKIRWKAHPDAHHYGALSGENEKEPGQYTGAPAQDVKVIHTYNHWSDPKIRDRSIRDTIFTAIRHAEHTIFWEDQYMVSLDVAKLLNQKLREPQFKKLTFITQSNCLTGEMLFPIKKRQAFIDTVKAGVSPGKIEIKEVAYLGAKTPWPHKVHAKLIIVDDELTIIGSQNCNSRSLTFDSESAVVIIDHQVARDLRERVERKYQGQLMAYRPNVNCPDLDDAVMNSRAIQIARSLSSTGSILFALLPTIWKLLWEIVEPRGPE